MSWKFLTKLMNLLLLSSMFLYFLPKSFSNLAKCELSSDTLWVTAAKARGTSPRMSRNLRVIFFPIAKQELNWISHFCLLYHPSAHYLSIFFKRDFVVESILSAYPINFLNCPLTFILMSTYILLLLCSCSLRKFLKVWKQLKERTMTKRIDWKKNLALVSA